MYSTAKSIDTISCKFTTCNGGLSCSSSDVLFSKCVIISRSSSSYTRGLYVTGSGTIRLYNCEVYTGASGTGNDSILFPVGKSTYLWNVGLKGGTGINYNGGSNLQTTAEDAFGVVQLD